MPISLQDFESLYAEDEHFDYVGKLPIGVAGPPPRLVLCNYWLHRDNGKKVRVKIAVAADWSARFHRYVTKYEKERRQFVEFDDQLSMDFFRQWCAKRGFNIDVPKLLKKTFWVEEIEEEEEEEVG